MKRTTHPLALPEDLLDQVRTTAAVTGLSLADAMRQSMKLGLPQLRDKLAPASVLKPFTKAEARRAFAPNPEDDALAARLAHRPRPEPPDEG